VDLGDWRFLPLAGAAIALPWMLDQLPFNASYLLILAATCVAFACLALGLNVVVGYAGLLNLGYIAFFAIGAYTYAILASSQTERHWPVEAVLPVAVLAVVAMSLLLGVASLRLRGDYLAIVTLGFGEIIRQLIFNLDRPINITGGVSGILGIDPIQLADIKLLTHRDYYFLLLAFGLIFVFVLRRWETSRIGRAWMAIRDDELAAQAMGIHVLGFRMLAFVSGAVIAGMTGVVYAAWRASVFPYSFTVNDTVTVFMMVIIGGMGSIPGVILGAIGVTLLPELLRQYAEYRYVIFGAVLILLMRFRPQGLMGAFSFRPPRRPEPQPEEELGTAPEPGLVP